ncbi:MAG: thiamine-phosphate kinase [Legionellaceae bacterium]|nr:thiamine-phosphate kinase [Legionellaceae bacterium]
MDEFSLIEQFFNRQQPVRYLTRGIGDDAAILSLPANSDLLISTDTLVSGVHFLPQWPGQLIAKKAVTVNVSDIVAMAGHPLFISLALTLPALDVDWVADFSEGFHAQLAYYGLHLIGGDTTRGPLSVTLTIHGTVAQGKAVRRDKAQVGDYIFVSGNLGAAALALEVIEHPQRFPKAHQDILLQALQCPKARTDLIPCLQQFATAAIDISDGLAADLNHICQQSQLGCLLDLAQIPIHPLVRHYLGTPACDFAMSGGDDYEICFTVAPGMRDACLAYCQKQGLAVSIIGQMRTGAGLYLQRGADEVAMPARGYQHF